MIEEQITCDEDGGKQPRIAAPCGDCRKEGFFRQRRRETMTNHNIGTQQN